jgi:hypothetical protein
MFIDDQTNNPQQGVPYLLYKKGLPPEFMMVPAFRQGNTSHQAFDLLNSSQGD